MTDSKKLLVFGSFTEDETKSLLLKKSSGSAEKPVKKNELQFGSINFSGGKFIPESDGESNKQFSANGPLNFQPSIKKTSNENSSVVAVSIPKENRIVNKPAATHPLDNGLKEQKINKPASTRPLDKTKNRQY
jgi:ubiquitin carboxyl-terminal hydrolase 10